MDIKFGTDGWRGVIGDDFNFKNVVKVSSAMVKYYLEKEVRSAGDQRNVVIGYDTRFLGEEAAILAAETFAAAGITPSISQGPVPTPCLSYQVQQRGLAGGIMITASHNPAVYNGIKFKAHYGGTADTAIYDRIIHHLSQVTAQKKKPRCDVYREFLLPDYLDYLATHVNMKFIGSQGYQIIWDSMHGACGTLFSGLFKNSPLFVKTIRSYPDPAFGGGQPEPIPRNLKPLLDEIKHSTLDVAFASDGDGDRLGVVSPSGRFLTPHEVFAMITLHLLENRQMRGGIAKTFSSSLYLDRIAAQYDVPLYETGIGFKYLCPLLVSRDVIIGGEESGGLAVSEFLPERDALMTACLLLEYLAVNGFSLDDAISDLRKRFGSLHYKREDREIKNMKQGRELLDRLKESPPDAIAGRRVRRVLEKDGVKLLLGQDGWLLLRLSGTEPLIRIYCELPTREAVSLTLKEAGAWL